MANSIWDSKYIITTVQNNFNQISKPIFSQALNTTLGLRDSYAPYTVIRTGKGDVEDNESFPVFPFGRLDKDGNKV